MTTKINHTRLTPMDTCMHLEHSMNIKRLWLYDDSCIYDYVEKFGRSDEDLDRYVVAYKPIILQYIWFMFIEMKFIHCHSCVIFSMKSMSMCND